MQLDLDPSEELKILRIVVTDKYSNNKRVSRTPTLSPVSETQDEKEDQSVDLMSDIRQSSLIANIEDKDTFLKCVRAEMLKDNFI